MTDQTVDPQLEEFAQQISDQVESFLVALQAITRDADGSRAISLLLLEVSQVLLAGARLGVQSDFTPAEEFQPDAGPDPDLDGMRLRLARMLDGVDMYAEVFDTYGEPEIVTSMLSDDLTSVASSLAHGLRHYKAGRVDEALWWWQFSYVSTWGSEASGVLRALQSIVTHDRLDIDFEIEQEQVAAADEMLEGAEPEPR
ncbi:MULTISPECIES: DUF5063 domain-containing protein [unclassified Nocardioides]|uniref:DUF5063 domain-containing protein n=1 Tax=unclassified Nocardioides TaxID=2615069 RepID=UPI0006F8541B|nr:MULTISPECIES: DUF5063 domain-containing protein [unclassified Nocardioides]KQY62660.1 hypothetical protein ASD30_23390 [Nocardioides sp. Root140]KQZ75938.1 hypothetical protein ASD66_06475 [Nocardioides sp. Root151]KRF15011.1 hypothetical protein ASH02_12245 [Nocardioides sp. Soil796]